MKLYQKLLLFLSTILFFLLLYGCSEEVYQASESNHYKKQIKTKLLNEKEAQKIISLLNQKMSNNKKLQILSKDNYMMRTSSGTIDYSKIVEVIDTIGIKNYTFLILNHPNDDLVTFHNLVIKTEDGSNDLKINLLKYTMSDSFASSYFTGQTLITEFDGTVLNEDLSDNDPCPDNVIVVPPQEPVTPISGGAGGGGSGAGSGGGSGSGGGGTSTGNPSGVPNFAPISYQCNSCSFSADTWEGFKTHSDAAGNIYSFTIVVNTSQRIAGNTSMHVDPCDLSLVGVLAPSAIAEVIEDKIDSDQLNPCATNVFQQVKNTTNNDFATVLTKLGVDGTMYNTTMVSAATPNGRPAQTVKTSPYNYKVYISTNYENKTKLFIATSMLHELVHAYFMSLFDDYHNGNPPNVTAYNDFPILFQKYVDKTYPGSADVAHHQQMAIKYVDAIAAALQEYQPGLPQQVYKDLAWGGLEEAPIFNTLFPVGSTDRNRIINRYYSESINNSYGYDNQPVQTPVGQPCN